ncbi:sulfatase-like hydrolase/transferase [soil metagenome]
MRLLPVALTVALPLIATTATGAAAADGRPHIVWINCEDLDPILAAYGDVHADTPHIDALAAEGIVYRNALANAPICAPARSCLITGMYPSSLGSQHLRCEITLPDSVRPFPSLLKDDGYFVTNYAKTDFNFPPDGIFDYWKKDFAPWRQRAGSAPFFSFFVLGTTHEGSANHADRYHQATADLTPSRRTAPAAVDVPPYFPNTPTMREIWARYYDLAAALDDQVGEIVGGLKADGLWEDSIVWFFSDHGHGLPRHKRWLLDSGLRVPFIVRFPEKYQHLAGGLQSGSQTDRLVTFVDFAPTVLSLAGVAIPSAMQGEPFLGGTVAPPRDLVFGARDRADDLFELSRSVHDGRYLYVRHFLPHLPYIQGGKIMGNQKETMAELRRARDADELDGFSKLIWAERKPPEELYDLESDPHEIHNLADDPAQAERLAEARTQLRSWILEHRDTGFLHEAEYHLRALAAGTSIYEMAQDPARYDLATIYAAADAATTSASPEDLTTMLHHADSGVRYWGAVGALAQSVADSATLTALTAALDDLSPSVAIAAAEALSANGHADLGLPVLERQIASEHPWVMLQAARALHDIGTTAAPAVDRMETVRRSLEGTDGPRRYRDFNYASFAGWALEAALINCGAASWDEFE